MQETIYYVHTEMRESLVLFLVAWTEWTIFQILMLIFSL